MKRKCLLILFFFTFSFSLSNAYGDTIVSVPLGIPGSPSIGYNNQYLVMSWTSSQAFTDVAISAYVYSSDSNYVDATAYLTTQIGPGATSTTLIDSNNITLPFSTGYPTPELNLFSGLDLGLGTYYLVLSAPNDANVRGWWNGDSSSAVTAPGVSVIDNALYANGTLSDTIYPPASDFLGVYGLPLAFDVTSTSSVPEPSTLLLLGAGLAGVGVLRRKLRK